MSEMDMIDDLEAHKALMDLMFEELRRNYKGDAALLEDHLQGDPEGLVEKKLRAILTSEMTAFVKNGGKPEDPLTSFALGMVISQANGYIEAAFLFSAAAIWLRQQTGQAD